MRALIVFGALLLGIVGLLMSVCGGGFLLMSLIEHNLLPMLESIGFIALPSLAIGAWFVYKAATIMRRAADRDDADR
jgi:hypothetical protein